MHYPFTTLVPSYASYLATFSAGVKTELENLVKIDSSIKLVDTYDLFLNLMNNSQKFGFDSTKFNQSCLVGGEFCCLLARRSFRFDVPLLILCRSVCGSSRRHHYLRFTVYIFLVG